MKQKNIQIMIAVGCLMTATSLLLSNPRQADAAAKFTAASEIAVQKGKTYRLTDFLDLAGTIYSDAGNLRKSIKKGKKVSVSGRGLTIKKKKLTFKVKKTGKYNLKIKTKKKTYLFPLNAVEKTYRLRADEIACIKIRSYATVPPSQIEINDRTVINQYVEKANQTKYTFSFPKTLKILPGALAGGYVVELYNSDGKCIQKCELKADGLTDTTVYNVQKWKSNYITWKSKSNASEFYKYVEALFQSVSSANTAQQ